MKEYTPLNISDFDSHKVPGNPNNIKLTKYLYYSQNGTKYIQVFTQTQSYHYFPKNQKLVALFDMDSKVFITAEHLYPLDDKPTDDQSYLMCPLTDAIFVKHDFNVSKYSLEQLTDNNQVQNLVLKSTAFFNDLNYPLSGAHGDSLYFGD